MLTLSVESGDPRWVAACARFAADAAARLGLGVQDADDLRLAVEEACHNVIAHAYEPGEPVRYQLAIQELEGVLVVGLTDQGLTFSLQRLTNPVFDRLDSVRLERLGRQGKRLELRKAFPTDRDVAPVEDAPLDPESPAATEKATIRAATPDDAVAIARCVYRCYGRSYGSQYMYQPERLKRLWETGAVTSVVALAGDEVVGHLLYWLDDPKDPAGQATDAVVDPRYRGHHLFEEMKKLLIELTRGQGRLGMISEAVTVHPYTQKGVLALGAVETGLMLGDLPSSLSFKAIESALPARQSCMLCYMRLNQEPSRPAFLPETHRPMLERIYSRVGLARELSVSAAQLEGEAQIETHLDPGWGEGCLRVTRTGTDVREVLHDHLRHALAHGVSYVYVELPLNEPAAGAACQAAEELGFSFAGLVPEAYRGDVLRLHYVTNLEVDPKIATASDWGAELRDYVVAATRR